MNGGVGILMDSLLGMDLYERHIDYYFNSLFLYFYLKILAAANNFTYIFNYNVYADSL
jgi:hypothetical protein